MKIMWILFMVVLISLILIMSSLLIILSSLSLLFLFCFAFLFLYHVLREYHKIYDSEFIYFAFSSVTFCFKYFGTIDAYIFWNLISSCSVIFYIIMKCLSLSPETLQLFESDIRMVTKNYGGASVCLVIIFHYFTFNFLLVLFIKYIPHKWYII